MPSATKTKRRTPRELLEQFAVSAGARTGSPLRIDEDAGVIFRVKVLGRFSRNNHGLTEAENGSEYSPGCMKSALADYEGRKVKCNHPADRANPGKERPVEDTFGILRNCVIESDEHGEPAIWADLHCLTAHPMYPRVVEDVKKGLGVYGLSHNAAAKRERFDRANKRLVIDELATVRSVDIVDKPATNRTLWESERVMPNTTTTSLRELLESRRPKLSKPRKLWADRLLEDDAMAPAMDAPQEMPEDDAGGDEDDALWTGIRGAIEKLYEKFKAGSMDAKEVGRQVTEYLKAHDKLTGDDEPEEPPADDASESEDDDEDDKGKGKGAMESEELREFRAEKAARQLCESLEFKSPTTTQIEAVAGMKTDKGKRELIESFKAQAASAATPAKPGFKTPKSAPPGGTKPPEAKKPGNAGREVQESEEERKSAVANDLAVLRNG